MRTRSARQTVQRVPKDRNSMQQRRWRIQMSEKPAYTYDIFIGAVCDIALVMTL